MKIIIYSLILTMWVLTTTLVYSQETEVNTVVIEQLEEKKEDVINAEKRALKQEIELINNAPGIGGSTNSVKNVGHQTKRI